MSDPFITARPPTPQSLLHRQPDKPDASVALTKPSKYIVLLMGSTGAAGKVQISKSVSSALSCPVFNGDSLHESSAKAATVGATRHPTSNTADEDVSTAPAANEARYQRMWLSKMTRTGLLFPEESRPAFEGLSGFGGASSTTTSRRGSASSIESASSSMAASTTSVSSSVGGSYMHSGPRPTQHSTNQLFTMSEKDRLRKANPALLVLTHPELETWHKEAIKNATREHGIGIVFVPLYEDDDLPILKPLDPRTMTSFGSFGGLGGAGAGRADEETILRIDINGDIEAIVEEIVTDAKAVMGS